MSYHSWWYTQVARRKNWGESSHYKGRVTHFLNQSQPTGSLFSIWDSACRKREGEILGLDYLSSSSRRFSFTSCAAWDIHSVFSFSPCQKDNTLVWLVSQLLFHHPPAKICPTEAEEKNPHCQSSSTDYVPVNFSQSCSVCVPAFCLQHLIWIESAVHDIRMKPGLPASVSPAEYQW